MPSFPLRRWCCAVRERDGSRAEAGTTAMPQRVWQQARFRIGGYNPNSITGDRPEEIPHAMKSMHIIGCPGTGVRVQQGVLNHVQRAKRHRILHWGLGGRVANKACGVALFVAYTFCETAMREIIGPPPPLQGRVGAAVVRQGDVYAKAIARYPRRGRGELRRGV